MLNLNRAMVIGNLTKDPEMRYTPNGAAVTSFSVATNRRWTGQDGNQSEEVEFHEVTAWGKLAEIASQVLKKGAPAYVEGRLRTRSWEGQDGVKRYKTEIVAENLIALSSRGSGTSDFTPSANPMDEITETKKSTPSSDKSEKPVNSKTEKASSEDEINIEDIPF